MTRPSAPYLRGQRIDPQATTGKETVAELIDNAFLAYNAGRLREGCQLFTERMLSPDVTVGMTLTGAMTPAGLGMSCLIPLMESGFVDWVISTGANLYHDAHFALGLAMHRGTPQADDVVLRDKGVVRIYDIFFDYSVLLSTDAFVREVSAREEFQRPMSTAEYHYLLGGYVRERERALGLSRRSVLAAAHELEVPIYTSSPGDSSIGMNVAEQALAGSRLGFDERGHDYFLQMTDARPDTGGLSGATPAEAVSWGKIDPDQLPGTVVVYGDTSIALPVLTAYARARHADRPLKRLYGRREAMMKRLVKEYRAALKFRDDRAEESKKVGKDGKAGKGGKAGGAKPRKAAT